MKRAPGVNPHPVNEYYIVCCLYVIILISISTSVKDCGNGNEKDNVFSITTCTSIQTLDISDIDVS